MYTCTMYVIYARERKWEERKREGETESEYELER